MRKRFFRARGFGVQAGKLHHRRARGETVEKNATLDICGDLAPQGAEVQVIPIDLAKEFNTAPMRVCCNRAPDKSE